MVNKIEQLKERIFTSKKTEATELTNILELAREFGALGEILGREFEVYNKKGELEYRIKQIPISVLQLNYLLKELYVLKKLDAENEAAKFGGKGRDVPKKLGKR
jgi:hypothetical protein